jgi:hypothetical protein
LRTDRPAAESLRFTVCLLGLAVARSPDPHTCASLRCVACRLPVWSPKRAGALFGADAPADRPARRGGCGYRRCRGVRGGGTGSSGTEDRIGSMHPRAASPMLSTEVCQWIEATNRARTALVNWPLWAGPRPTSSPPAWAEASQALTNIDALPILCRIGSPPRGDAAFLRNRTRQGPSDDRSSREP